MAYEKDSVAGRAAIAAGAAIGSAAIAAALLYVKRRNDKKAAARSLPAPTDAALNFPPETD